MRSERSGGILLHPTSLPGPYGIGDLGPAAYRWVDWLAGAGCRLWQVLPLGPTGYGDSPYQCFSAFAGNPYLISPELLLEQGLLERGDLMDMPACDERLVDFGRLYEWKPALLEKAYQRFSSGTSPVHDRLRQEFEAFRHQTAAWLDDFSLFMALKESHGGEAWAAWPEPLRRRQPVELAQARSTLAVSISRFSFFQYLFFRQWQALKAHALRRGIRLIGDVPIFAAYDSSDVWANQPLFALDPAGMPLAVAGVPPDYFSPTGQLWGNPLYRWEVHKTSGYAWWLQRLRAAFALVDIVRLDHFRGFTACWEIPAGSPTAENGRWVPGPGTDLFTRILPSLLDSQAGQAIIAEDLGVITPDVIALRDRYGFPGMKVLQFAFSGPDNLFLPEFYPENCVVYTGTHDNDTSRGWFETAPASEKKFACQYLKSDGRQIAWDLIRAAWGSRAQMAVAPLQDFLDLGSEARMNYPSRLGGNWSWRMLEGEMSGALKEKIGKLNRSSHR